MGRRPRRPRRPRRQRRQARHHCHRPSDTHLPWVSHLTSPRPHHWARPLHRLREQRGLQPLRWSRPCLLMPQRPTQRPIQRPTRRPTDSRRRRSQLHPVRSCLHLDRSHPPHPPTPVPRTPVPRTPGTPTPGTPTLASLQVRLPDPRLHQPEQQARVGGADARACPCSPPSPPRWY